MKQSAMWVPTLRETPSEAVAASHKLLLRGGFVRQLAAGLYIYLPLGWRVLERINAIIREEMQAIGAQEMSLPILLPAEPWQATGRWQEIGPEMFRLKDRTGRQMCLGMTHEEIMTWLAAREIRSYRQLPQIWYQLQPKLRDEARPKGGVLRTREFLMKDSYSFDASQEGLNRSYRLHEEAYHRIFTRCGLRFYQVASDPGMMGGGEAHEFMAPSPAGEDTIVLCQGCGYGANIEIATSRPKPLPPQDWPYEDVHTPERRTVAEVSQFMGVEPGYFIKSLLVMASEGPVLVLLRGDQELHEKKLQKLIGPFRTALPEEVKEALGVEPGFVGPMQHEGVRIIADPCLKDGLYISGANKPHYHKRGIRAGIHFNAQWHDVHTASASEDCPHCGGPLRLERAIEVGNIFKLGTKYSVPLKAFFLDEAGTERPLIMGSYGIGPARVAAAAVEQNHDEAGIIWPAAIAPFDVHVLPLNMDNEALRAQAERLYEQLREEGLQVLLDDRAERAGVKFNDADLIGLPKQLVVGEKNFKEGLVEIKDRRSKESIRLRPQEALRELLGWKRQT
jgi:prolyl-tRNA synthetase